MDAPRQWWKCFTQFLCSLGMKQSQLDPCIFYWYHGGHLHGVIALHVDDMLIAGAMEFETDAIEEEISLQALEREARRFSGKED